MSVNDSFRTLHTYCWCTDYQPSTHFPYIRMLDAQADGDLTLKYVSKLFETEKNIIATQIVWESRNSQKQPPEVFCKKRCS